MPESIQRPDVRLAQLFPGQSLGVYADWPVGPLRLDSRQVKPGDTFIALAGSRQQGSDFIAAAIAAGAGLVIVEADSFSVVERNGVPQIRLPNLRQQVSALASNWYGQPSKLLALVGITGTNGKTTCCHWLAQMLDGMSPLAAGKTSALVSGSVKSATIGTLGYGLVGAALADTGLTTPDAVAVQSILAELADAGANTVIAEVSSHSLDQGRVAGVEFDVAVFTNIGRDHLDYHGDLMSYVVAKTRLMRFPSLRAAVINLDDEFTPQFMSQIDKRVDIVTYSLDQHGADFSADRLCYSSRGTEARLLTPEGQFAVSLPIWGEFNLRNLLAILAAGFALGYPLEQLVAGLSSIRPVPGRLEAVAVTTDITVLVDFAHTPDALQSVLTAIRAHVKGNIWCVFGCGGDRDKGKRPLMAEVAQALADYVVVTSDNPRSENPAGIIDDVMQGFLQPQAVHRIEDRETAIRFAIEQAEAGDCVLLAGKGHEAYQLVGSRRLPFSDIAVARLALKVRPASESWEGDND